MGTVRDETFDLLRELGLTTIVGNPGSTEEPFLRDFPDDFDYVLALQEASVVGIADGLAQGLHQPVVVNVHTSAGMGNAMGCITTAFQNKTPLIVTAGQQTREMLLSEPLLTNIEATDFPRPWVKWSYEPKRPEDVPRAFLRAYAVATQQPTGPVFLSLPMDDWDKQIDAVKITRTVSRRIGPDPARLAEFASLANSSENPAIVFGADVARSKAWSSAVALAEKLDAAVWTAPVADQIGFPQDHPLHQGTLPPAIRPISMALDGHDVVLVIGAPVFRYYPYVPGDYVPEGTALLQITDDPVDAGKSTVGDSIVSDSGLAIEALIQLIDEREPNRANKGSIQDETGEAESVSPIAPAELYRLLSNVVPDDFVLVQEEPSHITTISETPFGTISKPDSYYTAASGGLGWAMPAAVGHALAERHSKRGRPVVAVIGDGSFQYSPQAIWTAVQMGLHVVFVVPRNGEYGILKMFGAFEGTPNVPGLDLPGLDIVSLGAGYGAHAVRAETADEITNEFTSAMDRGGVTVIEIPVQPWSPS